MNTYTEQKKDQVDKIEKSKNHLFFSDKYEFFIREGSIYRASILNPIMIDGFRCGRWEYPNRKNYIKYLREIFNIK